MAAPKEKKPAAKSEHKLDIFREMAEADRRNLNFYASLTEEEQKSFAPVVAMRWMSAVSDSSGLAEYYIVMTNDLVNIGFWDLYKHPELQWKLMAAAGCGQTQRHQWIPGSKKRNTNKLDKLILAQYPSLSDQELAIYKSKLTRDSLKQWLRDMGMPDDEIKPILEDFKKLTAEK